MTFKNIHSLNFSTQLELANESFRRGDATATVTELGRRIVTIQGYRGCIELEKLANKVIKAGYDSNVDRLSFTERCAGINIVRKINQFYRDTDAELATKKCFTKILCAFRETTCCFLFPKIWTRWQINECTADQFASFTEAAFRQEFDLSPDEKLEGHPVYSRREGSRIFARLDTWQFGGGRGRKPARSVPSDVPSTENTIGPNMVQSVQLSEICGRSYPCRHTATVTLKDGREGQIRLNGAEAHILLEATKESIDLTGLDLEHFNMYANFEWPAEGANSSHLTAENILAKCFEASVPKD